MHLKLLLPLFVAALLGQACIELPEIENPSAPSITDPNDAGTTNSTDDGGAVSQKRPPVLNETSQTAASITGGGVVTLRIVASDPQDGALNFSWETSAGVLGNPTSTYTSSEVAWTAPACASSPPETTAAITATVTNALGLSSSKSFNVICTCRAPEFTETRQSAASVSDTALVTLHFTAHDPQNSALSFSWRSSAGSIGIPTNTATTSEVAWSTPACKDSSPKETTATITATVTNALGLSASTYFNIIAICPKWRSLDAMVSARQRHTATLLPSGKVLVAGGYKDGNLASAEVFDPATRTWSPAGSMTIARVGHTATLLDSGKVLITGGLDEFDSFDTAEVYDPATNTWTSVGTMGDPRAYHTATRLPSGKVLVTGGKNNSTGILSTAMLYNPATNSWSYAGNMNTGRQGHTATLLSSGEVLIVGGQTAELYDPSTGKWSSTPSRLTSSRHEHTATLLPSGKVLVTGGVYTSSTEVYDPTTGVWTSAGSINSIRSMHTATLLSSGKVLVAGGLESTFESSITAKAEVYDPSTGKWSPTTSMPSARAHHTANLLSSGHVLIVGDGSESMSEIYEP